MILALILTICQGKLYMGLERTNKGLLGSASIPLANFMNMQFKGYLGFGTPVQNFSLIFDTGSSWLWLPSSKCVSCHPSNKFNQAASSTFNSTSAIIELKYGKGEGVGSLSMETVTIGESEVYGQPFILVNSDNDMAEMNADGILGMAFPMLSENQPTLVNTMFSQGIIEHPSFAVYIGDNDFNRTEESLMSMVIFGGYNLEKYSSDKEFEFLNLSTVAGNATGFWSLKLTSLAVGGKSVQFATQHAILDTGSSLLIGPAREVALIFEMIGGYGKCQVVQGLLICSCNRLDDYPTIAFGLNGRLFEVNPKEYLLADKGQCLVLIVAAEFNAWVLGDSFLRSYYTYYDMELKQIGIARSVTASVRESSYSMFIKVILITLAVIGVIGVAFFLRYLYIKRSQRRLLPQESYINLTTL